MSIRLKTILGVALIEAILLLLLVTMTLDYLRSTNYDGLVKRASTTATLFATTSKDAVLSYDLASLEAFVREVMKNPDLTYARVLGPAGEIFAAAGQAEALSLAFSADQTVEDVDDGVFDTYAEIVESGVVYGRVEIGLDISTLTAKIDEAKKWSAIIASIEMVLVALFSFILGAYLTGQLNVLTRAAKTIASGDLKVEVPVRGKDEIAEVALAFNSMAVNLSDASAHRDKIENELIELNRSLEDRVMERTQALQQKNEQLVQANQEIKNTQAKLLHSEKMASVGVLAAGVAHEINNPIGFVLSNIKTLEEYLKTYQTLLAAYEKLEAVEDPEKRKAMLAKIRAYAEAQDLEFIQDDIGELLSDSIEGTERVRDIVQGLKSFSHVDKTDAFALCDLNESIESTLKMANNELKYHCTVHKELQPLPKTQCRAGQINQVLLNLIMNAGQAIEGSGEITVRSAQIDDHIEISVTDTGKGIPADVIEKLFDPFFTTKPVGEGTGLGLAISYGIVKDHNGEIVVESTPGEGSCFTLRLPVVTEAVYDEVALLN